MPSCEVEFLAPREIAYKVISDFASYPEFVPATTKAKERQTRKGHFVDFEINLMKTVRYTIKVDSDAPARLAWSFVEGELMKDNSGSWELMEEGPNKTKAIYTVDVEFGWMVPKSIVEQLTKVQLPLLMSAFKERVEQIAARESA